MDPSRLRGLEQADPGPGSWWWTGLPKGWFASGALLSQTCRFICDKPLAPEQLPCLPPLPCQRGPIADRKQAGWSQRCSPPPRERARPSRLQPPGCRMITWVLTAAQRLTLIILSFIWHSVSKGPNTHSFIFFLKTLSFLNSFFSDEKSKTDSW